MKSTNKKVAAAAAAYGDAKVDNHVSVSFIGGNIGYTTPTFKANGQSTFAVAIPSGDSGVALDAQVGHEGVHVEQDQALAKTIQPDGRADQSLNLTSYKSEFAAYQVSAAIYQASGQPYSFDANGDYYFEPDSPQSTVDDAINRYLADPSNPYHGVTVDDPGPNIYSGPKKQ
ncbi:MAG: hypothetical protein WB680_18470 [Candidatus Acidiferrales bacterium]